MAASAFRRAGYDAYTMSGGLVEWEARGLPLEPDGRARGGALIVWRGSRSACARPGGAAARQGRRLRRPDVRDRRAGDASRVFVTERAGRVRVIRDGAVLATPFLDLTSITESADHERGLLSAAFAPDYATSGRFYVYLTATAAAAVSGTPGEMQVREYRRSAADPDVADPASARLLLSDPAHDAAATTTAGSCSSGPTGSCGWATGDGGGGERPVRPLAGPGLAARQADPARPGRAARRRCSRAGCATRGASRSIARPGSS